jgi:tetratricopeptide (TPR) repeat protein
VATRHAPPPTGVPDAYTLYLRGRYAAHKRTPEGFSLGIEYFQQAIERDPDYARAHAGLAECWALRGFPEFGDMQWSSTAPRARAAALEALRLDPRLAQAHLWLGVVHFLYDWDWSAAEARLRRALQLDPADAIAEVWYALLLAALGRHDEGLRHVLHAETLEPLSLTVRLCVGRCYYYARRFEAACEALSGLYQAEPSHHLTAIWLVRALNALGRSHEALEVMTALPPEARTPYIRARLAHVLAAGGRRDEAEAICEELAREPAKGAACLPLVSALALLDREEAALELLAGAVERRLPFVVWLGCDVSYDPLRQQPGFQRLLGELRLARMAEA